MRKLLLTTALLFTFALPARAATVVDVNGLVCDFCAQALTKVFTKQEAIEGINVDLDSKTVTLNYVEGMSLDDETITTLITDSGYNVVEIHHDVNVNEGEGADEE